jgi:hypothetical protein
MRNRWHSVRRRSSAHLTLAETSLVAEERKIVEFRSDDDDEVVLRLSFEPDRSGIGLDLFNVEVRTSELTFDHGVLTASGDYLSAFFADLARDWRGWTDTRRWDAVENGMSIDATHRGRVVELLFTLRRDYKPDAWVFRLPFFMAPGESMSRTASEIASLFEQSP